jgi:hypothetical protein
MKHTHEYYTTIGEHSPDPYFQNWTRYNLPQRMDYYITDVDLVIRSREGKLMIIEIKRRNSQMNDHQRTTYELLDGLIKAGIKCSHSGLKIPSLKFPVKVKYYGFHLLQFENTTFEDGRVYWNHQEVTPDQIRQILSFEISPFLR